MVCTCKPKEDISICLAGEDAVTKIVATLKEKTTLSDKIFRLRFKCDSPFDFQPGQFINLHRQDGLVRSYSIASLPSENTVELHIELIDNGQMSNWLRDELQLGETVELDGPHGECFYIQGALEQKLLLVGTGSGLAPLWGIARDALTQGHQGEIHLFHGSRETDKIYLTEELKQLATEHSNFFYTPCISGENIPGYTHGRANETALEQHPKLGGWRIYLCGHPEMVNGTKKKAFLAGASFNEIYADPFNY
ncbi:FAD-binding oxidoreductase [Pseudomonadota bacterium]